MANTKSQAPELLLEHNETPAPVGDSTAETNTNGTKDEINEELRDAACDDDAPRVQALLLQGAEVIPRESNRETALHLAARNRSTNVVRVLLGPEVSINVDAQDDDGWTALYGASRNGYDDVVKLLIGRTDGVDLPDTDGNTALHIAASNGHTAVVGLLLEKANPNAENNSGETALHKAVSVGNEAILKSLLERADPNARDDTGETALHKAASVGDVAILRLLLEKVNPNVTDYDGGTALDKAVMIGNEEAADLLLLATDRNAVLYSACQNNRNKVVLYLLPREADINFRSSGTNETPLHIAARTGHIDPVTSLVKHMRSRDLVLKEYIDAQDGDKWTPLYGAAYFGNQDIVGLLLDNDANPDLPDGEGGTALQRASSEGYKDIVKLLLDKKADPELSDFNGQTALQFASAKGYTEIVESLLEVMMKGSPKIDEAAKVDTAKVNAGKIDTGKIDAGKIDAVKIDTAKVGMGKVDARKVDVGKAWDLAREGDHKEVMLALLKHQDEAEQEKFLRSAINAGDPAMVQAFLDVTNDLSKWENTKAGMSVLTLAATKALSKEDLPTEEDLLTEADYWSVIWLLLDRLSTADFGGKDVTERILIEAAQHNQTMVTVILRKNTVNRKPYDDLTRSSWTHLHWAAYYGYSKVVYWLLVNGALTTKKDAEGCTAEDVVKSLQERDKKQIPKKDTKEDKKLAPDEKMKPYEKPINDEENVQPKIPQSPGEKTKKSQDDSDQKDFALILRLLQDPPAVKGRIYSGRLFIKPTVNDYKKQITCQAFHCTIMDFYKLGEELSEELEERVGFVSRSPTIYNVIYGDGPTKIMEKAMENLKSNKRQFETEKSSDQDTKEDCEDTLKFRWIHLPANNVS